MGRRALGWGMGLSLVAIATGGCGSKLDGGSSQSVFVRQALAPPADADAPVKGTTPSTSSASTTTCVYRPEKTWPSLREGVFDLGVADEYKLTLLVESEGTTGTRLDHAHVRVVRADREETLAEVDGVASGYVDGNGGLAIVDVTAIDPAATTRIGTAVAGASSRLGLVVEVSLSGTANTTDGPVTAAPFRLPVTACRGCLVSFETGVDPASPGVNCNLPLPASARIPCRIGQDEAVPCQACRAERPLCAHPE